MIVAVVLAGGVGSRVGAGRPKQFVEILGKPVIAYTLDIFQRNPNVDAIEVVCHKDWREYLDKTIAKNNFTKVKWIVDGGATFQESCMNGINHLKKYLSDNDHILIQYGAAPFTSDKIVNDVIRVMLDKGSAVTAIPCYQLLGTKDSPELSKTWVDRDKYVQIACPYGFKFAYIVDIYKRAQEKGLLEVIEPHTTSLIYALGDFLNLAYGDQTNIKITTKEDLLLFEGYEIAREKHSQNQ